MDFKLNHLYYNKMAIRTKAYGGAVQVIRPFSQPLRLRQIDFGERYYEFECVEDTQWRYLCNKYNVEELFCELDHYNNIWSRLCT